MAFTDAAPGGTGFIATGLEYAPGQTAITAPAAAPTQVGSATGGTLAAATYTFKVTFVGGTPSGETTPSPATTSYTATGTTSSVALSVIPTGGAGTTARKIYGSTDTVNYYYIATISDNTTTTYTVTTFSASGSLTPTTNTANIGVPGTVTAPTNYLPVKTDTLKAPWLMIEPEVMRGTVMSHAVQERGKIDPSGDLEWLLNPALGVEFFLGALGAKTSLSSVTATSTATPITTANGISTIPVTGAYTVGAMVEINTGANLERRQILSYSTGTMTVGALTNAANIAGNTLQVAQPAQDKYANSLLSGAAANLLPTLTIQSVKGASQWSWVYPYMMVDALDLMFNEKEIGVKAALVGSGEPLFYNIGGTAPATGTSATYSPNASDEAIALKPLTSIDGYIAAAGDPDATGTSTVRAALGVTDVKINFKNALEKVPAFNNNNAFLYFVSGKASCDLTYTEIMTSKRPDVWYDYIKASVAAPFFAGSWKNFGTSTAPSYKGVAVYVPNMKFNKQDPDTKIGAVNRWQKSGKALAPAGGQQDYLQIFLNK